MKKYLFIIIILLVSATAGTLFYLHEKAESRQEHELTLYGNVDEKYVQLSFQYSERISELKPEEGVFVKKGELLGKLETIRLEKEMAAVLAEITVQKAAIETARMQYARMTAGSRKEDVAIVRFIIEAIKAKLQAAQLADERQKTLVTANATSIQNTEIARSERQFLTALQDGAGVLLQRFLSGERQEDIRIAEAKWKQSQAVLERLTAQKNILEQKIKDAELIAPCDGIVRNRLAEPGEMTTAQKRVLTLAIINPKWIRCYLRETDLAKIRIGDKAVVRFDGADKEFEGRIGFISPNAEFTPKNIETEELRTHLVYETRIYVDDAENLLKLGAPATVRFPGVMVK